MTQDIEIVIAETELKELSNKIIGRLNGYCLMVDRYGLGLPVIDEDAMSEMQEIIIKVILRSKIGKQYLQNTVQWVSVEDNLPTSEIDVLVTNGDACMVACYKDKWDFL